MLTATLLFATPSNDHTLFWLVLGVVLGMLLLSFAQLSFLGYLKLRELMATGLGRRQLALSFDNDDNEPEPPPTTQSSAALAHHLQAVAHPAIQAAARNGHRTTPTYHKPKLASHSDERQA